MADSCQSGTANHQQWLKSGSVGPQEYGISDKATMNCTVAALTDTWQDGASLGYLNLTQGNAEVRGMAAARGFRIPRFAGRSDGVTDGSTNSASLFTEEGLILARAVRPIIKTDMGNFIDQYIVTQSSPASTSDSSLLNDTDAPLYVVRLRP